MLESKLVTYMIQIPKFHLTVSQSRQFFPLPVGGHLIFLIQKLSIILEIMRRIRETTVKYFWELLTILVCINVGGEFNQWPHLQRVASNIDSCNHKRQWNICYNRSVVSFFFGWRDTWPLITHPFSHIQGHLRYD